MTDRPIIFSGPMVRALIDGRKTQTRRLSGLSDVNEHPEKWTLHNVGPLGYMAKASAKGKFGATFESRQIEPGALIVCPQRLPYAPGDRLWVREAHALVSSTAYRMSVGVDQAIDPADRDRACVYREGWDRSKLGPWRPSIHMPRWASRLTLTVTDVRVQRLHEICVIDVFAEGAVPADLPHGAHMGQERAFFSDLWNSIHGPDAWDANPWVCALTFTVERRNIDQ